MARDKAEAEIKDKEEKMRKARETREARAKVEAEPEERERGWSGSKSMEKALITRLADEAREKTEFKSRERKSVGESQYCLEGSGRGCRQDQSQGVGQKRKKR